MHPIRPNRPLRRALGLAALPALVLTAAACSDSDGDDSASFCERYSGMEERFAGIDDPTSQDFDDAIDAIAGIDPPEEIADDWDILVEASRELADVDFSDPEALEGLDFSEADAASERIEAFVNEECGSDEEE
ncbi:MAG TPA: hypothetical protein VFZ77_01505 [Acidimicrobiales bacterium]